MRSANSRRIQFLKSVSSAKSADKSLFAFVSWRLRGSAWGRTSGELPSGLTSANSVEPSLRVEDSRVALIEARLVPRTDGSRSTAPSGRRGFSLRLRRISRGRPRIEVFVGNEPVKSLEGDRRSCALRHNEVGSAKAAERFVVIRTATPLLHIAGAQITKEFLSEKAQTHQARVNAIRYRFADTQIYVSADLRLRHSECSAAFGA